MKKQEADAKRQKSQAVEYAKLLAITQIGVWDWNLKTDAVVYSREWAQILGYEPEELRPDVSTWEKMVLPEDLDYANEQIARHLRGETPLYEAEFRMTCRDGSIIWAQDKGYLCEFDAQGEPLRFIGVLQNVSRMKNVEMELRTSRETLDLSVNVASLGTWDWDLQSNHISYNDEYLSMLGYAREEIDGSLEEWESFNHPDDLPHTNELLAAYIDGRAEQYECETRMKCRDGSYVWTRDVGRIIERDGAGRPRRILGAHLNIDKLKLAQQELEKVHEGLQQEVELRTRALVEQDDMLWKVNDIARALLTYDESVPFDERVHSCLRILGEATGQNRVYIWKDVMQGDELCCIQTYEWVRSVAPVQGIAEFENVPYRLLPSFLHHTRSGTCLNNFVSRLPESEQEVLAPQGIKTILVAPITVQGESWGFIGIDDCEKEELFSPLAQNMLLLSGFMIANAIASNETQEAIREVEERMQMMLNTTPLCCNLWDSDLRILACNDESVRLFGLESRAFYRENFYKLSPKRQPNGRSSIEMSAQKLEEAFRTGYCRFEWLHQSLRGEHIPCEITLVRIDRMGHEPIVAGYTRDLRETQAMLAEMHKAHQDLRLAHQEALLASRAKTNFLANMSHEIRTPMNAIGGLAEIILRDTIDDTARAHAAGIKQACGNLLNLINDILDISKIESGKLEIQEGSYHTASLLNDVLSITRLRIQRKKLLLVPEIDADFPAELFGDESRVRQILLNLLSNAVKFTDEGQVIFRARARREGAMAYLCFEVEDTGHGIAEEDLARLFEQFERVNTTKNRSIEGTGLGLPISKQLAEMMGGKIWVQSKLGVGSTFRLELPQRCLQYEPLASAPQQQKVLLYEPREPYLRVMKKGVHELGSEAATCRNHSEFVECISTCSFDYILAPMLYGQKVRALMQERGLGGKLVLMAEFGEHVEQGQTHIRHPISCLQLANILSDQICTLDESGDTSGERFTAPEARVLVVDDNIVNLQVVSGLLSPYGMQIETAENGLEALNLVRERDYDLVFMDHMMPVMDGIDATIAIRKLGSARAQGLPIVALTANAIAGTREMFLNEGMNDYLAKPVELTRLAAILQRWLPKEKQRWSVGSPPHDGLSTPPPEQERTGALLPQIAGLDLRRGIANVGGSRVQYRRILRSFYDLGCKQQLLLRECHAACDFMRLRTELHAIKSTAASLGAQRISRFAARLEEAAQQNRHEELARDLDKFLGEFVTLLEQIGPYLEEERPSVPAAPRAVGARAELPQKLAALETALGQLQIAEIERLLAELLALSWPKQVTKKLQAAQEAVAVFDYDLALAALAEIAR